MHARQDQVTSMILMILLPTGLLYVLNFLMPVIPQPSCTQFVPEAFVSQRPFRLAQPGDIDRAERRRILSCPNPTSSLVVAQQQGGPRLSQQWTLLSRSASRPMSWRLLIYLDAIDRGTDDLQVPVWYERRDRISRNHSRRRQPPRRSTLPVSSYLRRAPGPGRREQEDRSRDSQRPRLPP
jgi:hypothetical protein